MDRSRIHVKNILPRIEYVPRQPSPFAHKKQQINCTNDLSTSPHINGHILGNSPPETLQENTTHPDARTTNYEKYKPKTETISTLSASDENLTNVRQVKDSNSGIKNWYSHLTPGKQILVKGLMGASALLAVAAAVMLPVYFLVIAPQTTQTTYSSTTTTTTMYICLSTTCIGQETPYQTTTITALYPFDGNFNDLSGYNVGIPYGSSTPTTTSGYFSQAVSLSSTSNQYVQIPNFNLTQKTFTIEIWIYPSNPLSGVDYGMFGQCDIYNVCLSISLRNGRIVTSVDSMNVSGNTLTGSFLFNSGSYYWYHVAVVYDMTLFQLRIYVNGRIDAVSSGVINPYRGTISSLTTTTIGRSSTFANGTTYFNGRIDMTTISAGTTRSACQILNDASLVAYYPFDTTGTLNDYSGSMCNGYAYAITTVSSGRIGQAISFNSSLSYFQSLCFLKTRTNDQSYTYSLWINPTSLTSGGTLLHLSTTTNGGGVLCYDVLALTATGNIVVQWAPSTNGVNSALGPVIPVNTWTHVAVAYSNSNGVRLFINGQNSASSTSTSTVGIGEPSGVTVMYITLGNVGILGPSGASGCFVNFTSIVSGGFPGAIDTFRLYNRELTAQEICTLANP